MSQTPRHINTSRSLNRPDPAAAAPRHAASSTDANRAQAVHTMSRPPPGTGSRAGAAAPPQKKKTPLWLPFCSGHGHHRGDLRCGGVQVSLVNKVEDSIRPDDSTPTIEEEVKTDEEYKGDVVNILVCGIDYEEGRNYSNDPTSNDGMTDMILYVQFDIKNGCTADAADPPQQPLSPPRTKRSPFPMARPTPPRIIRSTRWRSPMAAASPLWPMSSTISSGCPSITM